jgi:hypothetical protein
MQRVGVVALDPETMPTPNWRFGKGAKRLSQRQRRRRSLEDDGAERALHRGFEPEYL